MKKNLLKNKYTVLLIICILLSFIICLYANLYFKSSLYNRYYELYYRKKYGQNRKYIHSSDLFEINNDEKNNLFNKIENLSKVTGYSNFNNVKSNKINYHDLKSIIPKTLEIIESDDFLNKIENLVNAKVNLTNDYFDRIFCRSYINKGDSINWHYDNNFSRGRRFTLVIPIYINKENSSSLQYLNPSDNIILNVIDNPNKLYIYEGDKIYHRVTEQVENGKRIVLIIPLYESKFTNIGKIKMKLKNFIFKNLEL